MIGIVRTLDIIREIEHDDALRAQLRAVLLGDEFLQLPGIVKQLVAEVKELAVTQRSTAGEVKDLRAVVKELAQAQQSTDAVVKELAEAQRSTDASVKELREAQRSTDASVKELAVAQRSTDAVVKELVEAQRSTDVAVKELREAQRSTDASVKELAEAQRSTSLKLDRLAEDVGEMAELSCANVLKTVAFWKGWTSLEDPLPIVTGSGEVDVRGHFDTPGGEVVVLAEAKSRLRGKDVSKWAARFEEQAWRDRFLPPGFTGQALPYVYGTLIYADAIKEAKNLGIGLLGPEGERLAANPA